MFLLQAQLLRVRAGPASSDSAFHFMRFRPSVTCARARRRSAISLAPNRSGGAASTEAPGLVLAFWTGLQTTYDIPGTPLFLVADLRLLLAEQPLLAIFAGAGVKFGS